MKYLKKDEYGALHGAKSLTIFIRKNSSGVCSHMPELDIEIENGVVYTHYSGTYCNFSLEEIGEVIDHGGRYFSVYL